MGTLQQKAQKSHRRSRLDGSDAEAFHAFGIFGPRHSSHGSPVTPVDDFDRATPFARQALRERVLERTAGGVIALTRSSNEALQRAEEQNEVESLAGEHLGEAHTDIYFCSQRCSETPFVETGEATVLQHQRCVYDPVNRTEATPDFPTGFLQSHTVRRIGRQVDGRRPHV